MHSTDSNGGRGPQRKISDIFLSEGMVTQEQLDEACELQKTDDRPIGKVLISLGYLNYEDLALALAKCLNMEYSTLTEAEADPEVLGIVNEEALLKHKAVPVRLENGRLVVAMSDPEDAYARSDIAISAGYPITPLIVAEDVVQRLQDQLFNRDNNCTRPVDAERASETGVSRVAGNRPQRIEPGSQPEVDIGEPLVAAWSGSEVETPARIVARSQRRRGSHGTIAWNTIDRKPRLGCAGPRGMAR